jgi:hypothetical protein
VEDFEVTIYGEKESISYRIHTSPPSELFLRLYSAETRLQIYCNYTRHHDGYLREKYLKKILDADSKIVTPYIFQLCGEYVAEIIQIIFDNKDQLNPIHFQEFIRMNHSYYLKTRDRMISYWDCYYRHQCPKLKDYIGYQMFAYFDRLDRLPSNSTFDADASRRSI